MVACFAGAKRRDMWRCVRVCMFHFQSPRIDRVGSFGGGRVPPITYATRTRGACAGASRQYCGCVRERSQTDGSDGSDDNERTLAKMGERRRAQSACCVFPVLTAGSERSQTLARLCSGVRVYVVYTTPHASAIAKV